MPLRTAAQLNREVLAPLKARFVAKDDIIDLMGLALVAGENLFLLGPPGTAKSALVHALAGMIDGRSFDYLFTRFTEPNEIFGPFDIRRLRDGELITNTEGMLPEAHFAFLDEILNANSAVLNSLLGVLNERVFRRGRDSRPMPLLMAVGASNHLPEEEALRALFDRFLLRVRCDKVPEPRLGEVLAAGWRLEAERDTPRCSIRADDIRDLQSAVRKVDLDAALPGLIELIGRLRQAGLALSDRRAVKLQKLVAASALLCGRVEAQASDLWPLRHIWDAEEQREVLMGIVEDFLSRQAPSDSAHPRSLLASKPVPEELARLIDELRRRLAAASASERPALLDQAARLAARLEWLESPTARDHLRPLVQQLLK